jgi:hypothetical protein
MAMREIVARQRANVRQAGGSRLDTLISQDATAHLAAIMKTKGIKTKREAVEYSLATACPIATGAESAVFGAAQAQMVSNLAGDLLCFDAISDSFLPVDLAAELRDLLMIRDIDKLKVKVLDLYSVLPGQAWVDFITWQPPK